MATSTNITNVALRALAKYHYDRAKGWWWVAQGCRLLTYLVSIGALFSPWPAVSGYVYLPVALLAVLSEVTLWRSDNVKGTAEALARKLDFRDSFGWPISNLERSDLIRGVSERVLKALPQETTADPYFAAGSAPGPMQAMQTLEESAWWSKDLAGYMILGYTIAAVILGSLSIGLMILSLATVQNFSTSANLARMGAATIALIFSLGLVRLIWGSYKWQVGATAAETRACVYITSGNATEPDAIKAWQEYHLARASSPLVPTFLYNIRRPRLNKIWTDLRKTP